MYVIWMACSLITRVASGRISSETHAPVELRRSPSLGSLSPKVRASRHHVTQCPSTLLRPSWL